MRIICYMFYLFDILHKIDQIIHFRDDFGVFEGISTQHELQGASQTNNSLMKTPTVEERFFGVFGHVSGDGGRFSGKDDG